MARPPWIRVKGVVDFALDRPVEDRARVAAEACGGDHALQAEVESLLAAISQADTFLERPAIQFAEAVAFRDAGGGCEAPPRTLILGARFGGFHVTDFIGAGGMGEVYRARDTALDRDVALKVRSAGRLAGPQHAAELRREAQALASLNHPNIAIIHGLEEVDGVQALVLEFVDGPTLAERVADRPIPLHETLSILKQITAGLGAAHQHGILHRDLKPANIKVRTDGTAKILDFGLARATEAMSPSAAVWPPAAGTSGSTGTASAVAGTPAYMSPELIRGYPADRRSDAWAFGCIVYEMVTGLAAFPSGPMHDTLTAVLTREPNWSVVPPSTPASLVGLMRRCLQKNPELRLHDMAEASRTLEQVDQPRVTRARAGHPATIIWAVVALATLAIGSVIGLRSSRADRPAPATPTVRRLLIGLPGPEPLARASRMPLGIGHASVAIAPSGTLAAYVMERGGATRLYLHSLDQERAVQVLGSEGAFGPFFSPDGQWLGFFADGKLKKVAVSGGDPVVLCDAPTPMGGSWGADGTILLTIHEGRRPVTVSATGGVPEPVVVRNDDGTWTRPHVLPGGGAAIVSHSGDIGVLSLASGEYRVLIANGSDGRYAPTGHLVFARAGALLAVPFDVRRRSLTGPEAVILDGVRMDGQRAVAQAAFSDDGTLIYVPGDAANDATTPVWVDRGGDVRPAGLPSRPYRSFSISPDGRRLAFASGAPRSDVWVHDFVDGTLVRLTRDGNNVQPAWTPDGVRVVFTARAAGQNALYGVAADGSATPTPLFDDDARGSGPSISPKGDAVAYAKRDSITGADLWARSLRRTEPPRPLLRTPFMEVGPRFSPDGRWLAYVSDETGRYEVYVRPYPDNGRSWRVSTHGGEEGLWSHDGRELFYRNGNQWMAVPVRPGSEFRSGQPRLLFEGPYVNVGGFSYDVSADGHRFLVLQPDEPATTRIAHLNVVLNWFDDIRRKAHARQPSGT